VQAAGGRLVLCEVGPFLNKFFETAQPAGLLCIRGGEQEALQALTRSAGGGLASFSHAHFAGANGGMAMGAEDPEERTEAPPAKAQAAGTVFWLLLLAVQLPTAATP